KKPADRYQTPAELVQALEPFATPERNAERFRPPKEKEKDPEWRMPLISQTDVTLQRPAGGVESDATEADIDTDQPKKPPSKSGPDASHWPTLQTPSKATGKAAQTEPMPAEKKTAPAPKPALLRTLVAIGGGVGLAVAAALAWKASTG